jgi:RNA polymerase sigma-70 factor (ECF subfamily)
MDACAQFRELATKYTDTLYNYARLLTRRPPEAEDLLQETLLHAFRALPTLDQELSPKAWLLKIMKHRHIDRCRRKQSRPMEEEFDEERQAPDAESPLNPEEILLQRLAIEEVRTAIRRLPPAWREAVELRDIEGLSYLEIAHVLDRPIGTVMSRLYRGRNLLRSYLQERQTIQPRGSRDL